MDDIIDAAPIAETPNSASKSVPYKRRFENANDYRPKRQRNWMAIAVFLLFAFAFVGAGYLFCLKVWEENYSFYRETIYKKCTLEIDSKTFLTGTRTLNLRIHEFLGYRFIEDAKTVEKTHIHVKGDPLTIIGYDKNHNMKWSRNIGPGEFYDQMILDAYSYTIVYGRTRTVATTTHKSFCHNARSVQL